MPWFLVTLDRGWAALSAKSKLEVVAYMVSFDFILDFLFTGTLECCQVISVYSKSHDNEQEENGQAATAAKAGAWLRLWRTVSRR